MVSHEDSGMRARSHVPRGIVLWALWWLLVQHSLTESNEPLAKVSASRSRPSRSSIGSDAHGIDEQRRMLNQPTRERMSRWDDLTDATFGAELQCSEQASHCPYPHLRASVGGAFVLLGLL